jgi:hypothetical protein
VRKYFFLHPEKPRKAQKPQKTPENPRKPRLFTKNEFIYGSSDTKKTMEYDTQNKKTRQNDPIRDIQ